MIDVSDLRCEKGKRILHHKWRLNKQEERPASNYIGIVDHVDVDIVPNAYRVSFHENNQTLTQDCYLN